MPTTTKKRKPRAPPAQKQKQKQKQSVVVNINNAPKRGSSRRGGGTPRKRVPPHPLPPTSHTFFTSVHAPLPASSTTPSTATQPTSSPTHHTGTTNIFNNPTTPSPIKDIKIPQTQEQNTPIPSSFKETGNHWSRDSNFNNAMDNYGFYNNDPEEGTLHYNPLESVVQQEQDVSNDIIIGEGGAGGDAAGEAASEAASDAASDAAAAALLRRTYKTKKALIDYATTLSINTKKTSEISGKLIDKNLAELISDIIKYNKGK